jgi:hypothetical protein
MAHTPPEPNKKLEPALFGTSTTITKMDEVKPQRHIMSTRSCHYLMEHVQLRLVETGGPLLHIATSTVGRAKATDKRRLT